MGWICSLKEIVSGSLTAAISTDFSATAPDSPNPYARLKAHLARHYERVAVAPAFIRVVIIASILFLVVTIPSITILIGAAIAGRSIPVTNAVALALVASVLVSLATLIGVIRLARHDRIGGLEWLRTSLAISILLAAPIEFWTDELAALPSFILTLLAYGALGFALRRERERADSTPSG